MLKVILDGARGTGKSTVARLLQKALRLPVIEVGVLFRVTAFYRTILRCRSDVIGSSLLRDIRNSTVRIRCDTASPLAAMSVWYSGRRVDAFLWSSAVEHALVDLTYCERTKAAVSEALALLATPRDRAVLVLGREVGRDMVGRGTRVHLIGARDVCLARKQSHADSAARGGFTRWTATPDLVVPPNLAKDITIDTGVVSAGAAATIVAFSAGLVQTMREQHVLCGFLFDGRASGKGRDVGRSEFSAMRGVGVDLGSLRGGWGARAELLKDAPTYSSGGVHTRLDEGRNW